MLRRRIITILCLLSLLPTTVDPSCIGYFMYSNDGFNMIFGEETDAMHSSVVSEGERPAEGLAASRIPSHVSITPHIVLDLWACSSMLAPRVSDSYATDAARDFLAPSQHDSFLRHSVLLI